MFVKKAWAGSTPNLCELRFKPWTPDSKPVGQYHILMACSKKIIRLKNNKSDKSKFLMDEKETKERLSKDETFIEHGAHSNNINKPSKLKIAYFFFCSFLSFYLTVDMFVLVLAGTFFPTPSTNLRYLLFRSGNLTVVSISYQSI